MAVAMIPGLETASASFRLLSLLSPQPHRLRDWVLRRRGGAPSAPGADADNDDVADEEEEEEQEEHGSWWAEAGGRGDDIAKSISGPLLPLSWVDSCGFVWFSPILIEYDHP